MRDAWVIALKDLKLRIRDRSVFIYGVLAPLALAFVLNFVFGAGINVGDTVTIAYGIVDLDNDTIGQTLIGVLEGIEAEGIIETTAYESVADAEAALETGEVASVFVVPPGTTVMVQSGQSAQLEVIGGMSAPTSSLIARSIAERFAVGIETGALTIGTAIATGAVPPEGAGALVGEVGNLPPAVVVEAPEVAIRQLDSTTYLVAGFAMFFLFFVTAFGVTSLLEERTNGTMARLVAAPIRPWSVVAGKALTSFIVGLVSMTVLFVAASLLMGADWGPWPLVALLVFAGVTAGVGMMTFAGFSARTAEQAGNLQAIVAVVLAMIGGVFFPIGDPESFIGQLSLFSPHAWFLRGLGDLAGGGGIGVVLPAFLALMAFGVGFGVIGLAMGRRVTRP